MDGLSFFAEGADCTDDGRFSSLTCVVGTFSSVINRRPNSLRPIAGNSSVEDNAGAADCNSSMNFFLLVVEFFFFCFVDDA